MKLALALVAAAAAAACTNAAPVWNRVSRSPAHLNLRFHASLPLENKEELEKRFWAVSDPKSPSYGQFMSKAALDKLTAAPQERVTRVVKNMKKAGAACEAINGNTLECTASVPALERLLSTEFHRWELVDGSSKGRHVHGISPTQAYTIPDTLAEDVEFFMGLTVSRPPTKAFRAHEHAAGKTASSTLRGAAAAGATAVTIPETIWGFYGADANHASSSDIIQTAVEFEADQSFSKTDLSSFITKTDIPSFEVSKIIGSYNPNPADGESSLDVQYLGGVGIDATNYFWTESQWVFHFAQHFLSGDSQYEPTPSIVSISWGGPEADQCDGLSVKPCTDGGNAAFISYMNAQFQKIGLTGATVFVAAGDNGAHGSYDPFCTATTVNPSFPTSSPYVTSVGATQFNTATVKLGGTAPICTDGTYSCMTGGDEIVCSTSTGAIITSGGGFSQFSARPAYQDDVVKAYLKQTSALPPASDFNSSGRGYPDVTALGHAYAIQLNGDILVGDGTSASTPVWAGLVSRVNAARKAKSLPLLGFLNQALYQAAAANPDIFNDITTGNNKCTEETCCSTGFTAVTGWDATSGLGSPNFPKLFDALVSAGTNAAVPKVVPAAVLAQA